MTPIQTQIQDTAREFDDEYNSEWSCMIGKFTNGSGTERCLLIENMQKRFKSFLLSSQEKLIETIVREIDKPYIDGYHTEDYIKGFSASELRIQELLQTAVKK